MNILKFGSHVRKQTGVPIQDLLSEKERFLKKNNQLIDDVWDAMGLFVERDLSYIGDRLARKYCKSYYEHFDGESGMTQALRQLHEGKIFVNEIHALTGYYPALYVTEVNSRYSPHRTERRLRVNIGGNFYYHLTSCFRGENTPHLARILEKGLIPQKAGPLPTFLPTVFLSNSPNSCLDLATGARNDGSLWSDPRHDLVLLEIDCRPVSVDYGGRPSTTEDDVFGVHESIPPEKIVCVYFEQDGTYAPQIREMALAYGKHVFHLQIPKYGSWNMAIAEVKLLEGEKR